MKKKDIERLGEFARKIHHKDYNCAQAVACTLCGLVGLDHEEAFRLSEGYGAGLGDFKGTCGVTVAAVTCISYAASRGTAAKDSAVETSGICREFMHRFEKKIGSKSALCADIRPKKPKKRGPVCNGYVGTAVETACKVLDKHGLIAHPEALEQTLALWPRIEAEYEAKHAADGQDAGSE